MIIYQPLEDRILVKHIKKTEPEKTQSGIILDTIKKETTEAEVLSVGVGIYARETGVFMPTVLAKGDFVLVGAEHGMPLEITNESGEKVDCRVMREADVLFLLKKSS